MTIDHIEYENYSKEILIRKFEGTVTVGDIISSWQYLIENEIIKSNHKGVINDVGNCVLDMNQDSLGKLMQFLKANPLLKNLKHAVLSDSPQNIVFPFLAQSEQELKIKPFSTFQAALKWIMT